MDFSLIPRAGLTQREFAEICGVSRTTVNLWSTGKMSPHRFIATQVQATMEQMERAITAGSLPLKSAQRRGAQRLATIRALLEQPESAE